MEDSKVMSQSRKRPFEKVVSNINHSSYDKVRKAFKDLRPHFIEVLKSPDFQNCKAAGDVREGMKLLINLYKGMISESIKIETCKNNPPDYSTPIPNAQKPADHWFQGKIIGGSAFGWNFITFDSNLAVYYGRSKEDFRAANPKSTE